MRRAFVLIFPLAILLWWMQLQHLNEHVSPLHANVDLNSERNITTTTQEFLANHNDTYIIHYPFTEFGQMCNNMHQISAAIDLALAFPKQRESKVLVLAFDKDMGDLIRASFDVEYLRFMLYHSAQIKFANLNPEFDFYKRIELLLDWPREWTKEFHFGHHTVFTLSPKRFQFSYGDSFSFGAALFVQPRADLKSKVQEWLDTHTNTIMLSMHRRNFYKCNPVKRQYSPFCRHGKSAQWRSLRYFENDCNVTWTPQLELELKQLWPDLPQNFTILLATDSNDKAGDSTFPQTVSIPQSLWQFPISSSSPKQQKRLGVGSTWDLSMLVDMWGQVLAPYSIGQPWSSCDRILAMWKSKYSRAAFRVYEWNLTDTFSFDEVNSTVVHRMYPVKCYSDFESPSSPQVALKVVKEMRTWWENVGLKHNITLPRQQYDFPSMEHVAVKYVRVM